MAFDINEPFYTKSSRYVRRAKSGPTAAAIDLTVTPSFPGLAAPAAPTLTANASGGVLAAATYGYRVSALNVNGETLPSVEATVTTSGTTGSVSLAWVAVTGATGYRVYGRTAGAELLLATLGNVLAYVDTGASAPVGAMPLVNSTQTIANAVAGQVNAGDSLFRTPNGGVASIYNPATQSASYVGESESNYPKTLGIGSNILIGSPPNDVITPRLTMKTNGEFRKKTTAGDVYAPGALVYVGADPQTVTVQAVGTAIGRVCNDQTMVFGSTGLSISITGAPNQEIVVEINPPGAV